MVTLQILVLPFLVRVRVPQQKKTSDEEVFFCFLAKSMAAMDEKKRAKSSRNDFARIH